MSIIPRRYMWLVLRRARGAITATILTPVRLTDTTAPAGSGAAYLSAPGPGITAGMATRGVGAMDMQAITAGGAATDMGTTTATEMVITTGTTDIAAAPAA